MFSAQTHVPLSQFVCVLSVCSLAQDPKDGKAQDNTSESQMRLPLDSKSSARAKTDYLPKGRKSPLVGY